MKSDYALWPKYELYLLLIPGVWSSYPIGAAKSSSILQERQQNTIKN